MELSAYEKQRAANIHRNRQCLVDLGIDAPLIVKTVPIKPAPSARKRKVEDEAYTLPSRRASARTVERETKKEKAAKASDDDDDDDDDEDYEDLEDVVREKPKKKRLAQTKEAPVPGLAAITSCIIVEAAKTSRSKCRRCMEILAAGSLRVGMESWMVGRQVSGRTKCKQTQAVFAPGEARISASAHKTTLHIKLAAAPALLRPIFAAVPESDRVLPALTITGFDQLSKDEQRVFTGAMSQDVEEADIDAKASAQKVSSQDKALQTEIKKEQVKSALKKQPPMGKVSKTSGKVCWLFAGKRCYGHLLPGKETVTMCYAKTHKGNTKTLTKGGSYWWMLEE